ncbi:hypothetical protein KW794_01850 [Candidatus Saccharibacteria bacterium]|nr:hypothetical protein [Candidatus Saccharibacteria bacterium]
METEVLGSQELDQQMDINAVMLLRDMHETEDLQLQQRLFEQAADQEASLISEVLEGIVITDFKFETQNGKLYLLQPNGVTDWRMMHGHGVKRAEAKAAEDHLYQPYVKMAEAELTESQTQEAMVRNGEPAAMVKLSLCGEDVMSTERVRKLGRDPDLRRAFLRVSVFDGKDMHIHSRSIDKVNLTDGRGIATGWGSWEKPQMDLTHDASSVDILRDQLYFDQSQMSIEQMHGLADKLVAAYDKLQATRNGKIFKAGRCPEDTNTYKFVLDNQDLLNAHLSSLVELAAKQELPIGHLAAITNDLRYDIMSSFKQRLDGKWKDMGSLGESVAAAGAAERASGTQYGGCDTVIGAQTAENAGYLNGQSNEIKANCVKCPSCESIVDLPKKLLDQNIMHCVQCKASAHTKGGKVNQKIIDDFYGITRQEQDNSWFKTESFGEYWARLNHEQELKNLRKEADLAQSA